MPDQPSRTVLKIAVRTPLYRIFDYLPPADRSAESVPVGARVRIPFGTRKVIGLVWDGAGPSSLEARRLRRVEAVLDSEPLLESALMRLLRFASDYYLHAPGEVAAAALPQLLRSGRPLACRTEALRLADNIEPARIEALIGRAPRQAELVRALAAAGPAGLTAPALDRSVPGWRRFRRAVVAKGLALESSIDEDDGCSPTLPVSEGPELDPAQAAAVAGVLASGNCFSATLIDGVTGSGKTEVYLRLAAEMLQRGRQTLLLVPEIGLTPQLIERVSARLGTAPAVLHSALTDAERLSAWRGARAGGASVVVGTRSAIFCPFQRLGLVVVDEEHDPSLKQQEGFRYSARDLAVARARDLGIPVVLGSATPSLESLANAAGGRYSLARLPARAGAARAPRLRLVDLNVYGSDEGISGPLREAIDAHLEKAGQVLIYLNRRGYAPTMICRDCGHIVGCARCDARMTLHASAQRLICHHCGALARVRADCEACGGRLTALGEGTEKIEDALHRHFPARRIVRIDSDSTRTKRAFEQAFDDAQSGRAEILVGTQMLSKGHHFPALTLVGIVNADQGLFGSDFRATERLAQSLIQVAGRAGREEVRGEVVIQTAFPEHPLLKTLLRHGYERFAECALVERRQAGWPPFASLALLRAQSAQRASAWEFLESARDEALRLDASGVRLYGPVRSVMERRAGLYRSQLLLHARERSALRRLLVRFRPRLDDLAAAVRVRWSLDVDPIELF